jgi:hypothetical protein
VFYFAMAAAGGFEGGAADWHEYGEEPGTGLVKQPIAFWTDLGFIVSGIAALLWCDLTPRGDPTNPMVVPTMYSVGLGLVMVWMGPGSMLEHGALVETWGWFDASSIHWYALFLIGYLVLRWIPGASASIAGGILFWVGLVAAAVAIGVWGWLDESVRAPWSMALMGGLGVAYVGSLVPTIVRLVAGKENGLMRFEWPALIWGGVGVAAFVAGMIFLATGSVDGATAPWGHGAFHLAMAVTTLSIYATLRLEMPRWDETR